jgi:hypothetical protein
LGVSLRAFASLCKALATSFLLPFWSFQIQSDGCEGVSGEVQLSTPFWEFLGVRTFGEVINELINIYEGFKSYRNLDKLLQLINNAQQIVSELREVLNIINQNSYENVKNVVNGDG